MYASGGKKCSLFGKFGVFSFLVTPVLRFVLLPCYQRINIFRLSQASKMELLTNIGNSFCLIRFWIDLWRLHLFSVILRKIGRIWLQRALNLLYNLSIIFSYWFSKFDNLNTLLHLISWCGNFVDRHSFRTVSGETMGKLCLSTKFPH